MGGALLTTGGTSAGGTATTTGGSVATTGGASADGSVATTGGASASGGATTTDCTAPPAAPELIGWASTAGNGVERTTGGGNVTPTTVTSLAALNAAVAGAAPGVVYIRGNLSGKVVIGSNKTLVGLCGATITGDVHLSRSVNVILRNLKIVGNNCSDSPTDCSGGADAVSVSDNAHHIWFDHLDVSDGSDGNLDITSGSDLVTVSWSKFHYSAARTDPKAGASGHRFSNLIGSGDNVPGDVGRLNVTFHHVWWADHIDQRMPRTRYGKVHVFNSLYTAVGNNYCVGVGMSSSVRVESNVFAAVNKPFDITSFVDAASTLTATGDSFSDPIHRDLTLGTAFTPPYVYALEAVSGVEAAVRAGVGPR